MDDMAGKILDLVRKNGSTTLAEIVFAFGDEVTGDYTLGNGKYRTVIYWEGLSKRAVDAIIHLVDSGQMTIETTFPLVYYMDGMALNRPIAKRFHNYKEPHWMPIVFNPVYDTATAIH